MDNKVMMVTEQQMLDDCDDCKLQKKQNEKLIDFYERLSKMKQKLNDVKSSVEVHKTALSSSYDSVSKWTSKMQQVDKNVDNTPYDVSSMGFQLASMLLERKRKMDAQNRHLKSIVSKIKKEKRQLQNNKLRFSVDLNNQSRLNNKSELSQFDNHSNQSNINYFDTSPKRQYSSYNSQATQSFIQDSTQSSHFDILSEIATKKQQKKIKHDIKGLNLWLYDNEIQSKFEQELYSPVTKTTRFKKSISKKE